MNKLDVIPAQVSARQRYASKREAQQDSEASDTGLVKGFNASKCRIRSLLVGNKFCLIAAPWRQIRLGVHMDGFYQRTWEFASQEHLY